MAQRPARGAAAAAQPALAAGAAQPPPPPPPPPAAGVGAPRPAAQPVRAWAVPEKFPGGRDSDWRSWLLQFETVARVNGWTPVDQAAYLSLYLSDNALSYFHSLPLAVRQGPLPALLQALGQRFDAPHQVEVFRAELKSRRQKSGESLSDYAEVLHKLARQAYPTLQPDVQDMLAKDQFVAGLDSREVRFEVRKSDPDTLDAALQQAFHVQAIQLTEQSPAEEPLPTVCAVQRHTSPVLLQDTLDKLCQRMDALEAKLQPSVHTPGQTGQTTGGSASRRCYTCDSRLHLARDCPHRDGARPRFSATRKQENSQ